MHPRTPVHTPPILLILRTLHVYHGAVLPTDSRGVHPSLIPHNTVSLPQFVVPGEQSTVRLGVKNSKVKQEQQETPRTGIDRLGISN